MRSIVELVIKSLVHGTEMAHCVVNSMALPVQENARWGTTVARLARIERPDLSIPVLSIPVLSVPALSITAASIKDNLIKTVI